jgi:hypothetical protein
MRFVLFALSIVAATTLFNTPTKAQNYPWCAIYNDGSGSKNCGFASFQQCQADVSGIGGFCTQNSTYQPFAGPGRV